MATKADYLKGLAAVEYDVRGEAHCVDHGGRVFVNLQGQWRRTAVDKAYVVEAGTFKGLIDHPLPLRSV